MGNKQSDVSTDTYVREVRNVRIGMSDRDRKLYNFARIKIAEEDIDDAEITIGFQDQNVMVLQAVSNPSGKVYIGVDFEGNPQLVWSKRGIWRSIKSFFIGCFNTLKGALFDALAIGISETRAIAET